MVVVAVDRYLPEPGSAAFLVDVTTGDISQLPEGASGPFKFISHSQLILHIDGACAIHNLRTGDTEHPEWSSVYADPCKYLYNSCGGQRIVLAAPPLGTDRDAPIEFDEYGDIFDVIVIDVESGREWRLPRSTFGLSALPPLLLGDTVVLIGYKTVDSALRTNSGDQPPSVTQLWRVPTDSEAWSLLAELAVAEAGEGIVLGPHGIMTAFLSPDTTAIVSTKTGKRIAEIRTWQPQKSCDYDDQQVFPVACDTTHEASEGWLVTLEWCLMRDEATEWYEDPPKRVSLCSYRWPRSTLPKRTRLPSSVNPQDVIGPARLDGESIIYVVKSRDSGRDQMAIDVFRIRDLKRLATFTVPVGRLAAARDRLLVATPDALYISRLGDSRLRE
jgi:hypothetical protein